jgi:hypothetical protein
VLTAASVPGTAAVTGTLNDEPITDTAFVVFRPRVPSAGTTTITADSAAINADGMAQTRVLVTLLDGDGLPVGVSAGTVNLSTSLGDLTATIDHGDGTYSAMLSGTTPGTAIVTGTLNDEPIADSARVTLRSTAGDPDQTIIRADSSSILADGAATTRVLVLVRDSSGRLLETSAGMVTLTTTLGSLSDVIDHNDGTYSAILRAGLEPGKAVITGTLNGAAIASSEAVRFREP